MPIRNLPHSEVPSNNPALKSGAAIASHTFVEVSISPGGELPGYQRRVAEAHLPVRAFVHADPGADNLPAPSPDEFDQGTLEWVFGKADHIAVCWPASADDKTQTKRLAKWITWMGRKPASWVLVVEATAEWHLHWLYSAFLWRSKGVKVDHFGEFPVAVARQSS